MKKKNRSSKILFFLITLILSANLMWNQTVSIKAEDVQKTTTTIKEPDELYALSAVLMDADSGRILFSKNGQEEMAMASTTKIMTCILALEYGDLEQTVTVSANAAAQPAVHLCVNEGQQFILRDLLYSLMLESHNDAAVIIAEAIGTTEEGFADLMNQKAAELGCKNTYFITPNGLDDFDEYGTHHTTAEDLARIMKYCIMDSPKKDWFLKITQTMDYSFSDVTGSSVYSCTNHNSFLKMMEGALSGKTGFTNEAGYCYVGALENEGRTFIVTLLACGWPNNKNYKWSDTRKLMKYGIDNFHYRNIYEEIPLENVSVINGIPDDNRLYGESTVNVNIEFPNEITTSKELYMLLRDDENISINVEQQKNLAAPVLAGTEIGKVTFSLDDTELYSFSIVTSESKDICDLKWYARQLLDKYLL